MNWLDNTPPSLVFFKAHFGENLSFEQFSHLLQSMAVPIGFHQAVGLFKNYQNKQAPAA